MRSLDAVGVLVEHYTNIAILRQTLLDATSCFCPGNVFCECSLLPAAFASILPKGTHDGHR
jgi:hypothetical protein